MEDHSNNTKGSPVKFWQAMAIQAGASIVGGLMGRAKRRKQQREAKIQYDKMKKSYEGLDTRNLYAGVKNPYADMENVYEDLTVDQQSAQFQAQQGAQQRANIMQGLRGAAGTSGIAGLAQSLAGQAQMQTQQASASIAQQEAQNRRLRASEASRLQLLEREGAQAAQTTRLAGEESSRGLKRQKVSTLFGMSQQRYAAANEAVQAANEQIATGIGQAAGAIGGAYMGGISPESTTSMPFGMDKGLNLDTSTTFQFPKQQSGFQQFTNPMSSKTYFDPITNTFKTI